MSSPATTNEFLAAVMGRLFAGARSVGVGANSPVAAAGALLARALQPAMFVSILGSSRDNPYTNGGAELFDFAAQGRLECFVLSGVQIDGSANLNLVSVGPYERPHVRYPGSFGSGLLYYVVPRVILFREEHSPRVLVPQVDFISAPGVSEPGVYRPGGPTHLLTGKALFAFDRPRARFRLQSVHPGETLQTIAEATGFSYDCPAQVPVTAEPSAAELALLRGPVHERLSLTYPAFARMEAARSSTA